MKGDVWLCVEIRGDGSILVNGDTGKEGFEEPQEVF